MMNKNKILSTGRAVFDKHGEYNFVVDNGVNVISFYGCGGGEGGRSGITDYGYQVSGHGGYGGNGSVPHYWLEDGSTNIPVNPGDTFKITVGAAGQSDKPGQPTVVTTPSAPGKTYIFGGGAGLVTSGGWGAYTGRDTSRSGADAPDPRQPGLMIAGGQGARTWDGNHDEHWGGAGGGGGAGMAPGGRGGLGGCDGGSQGGYPGGSHDPAFRQAHSGKAGENAMGNGAGGGGGGGPGDGADDHIFDPGGPGGVGGDGYLEINW